MGRSFAVELQELPATYRWAMKADIRSLTIAIRGCLSVPLVAVGSGGSLTVADFAAKLHRDTTGLPAFAETPLDAVTGHLNPSRHAVLMTTAGGRNPDVVGSFHALASREPRRLVVLCLSAGTPLAARAKAFPFVDFVELAPPTARDGFLATNSLIASALLLLRAYADASAHALEIPATWRRLLAGRTAAQVRTQLALALERRTLIVLHGADTRAAAIDIESKMTEAALGNVWTADYRHFAHGRHHWLAKRGDESAVLALISNADRPLAEKTLSLLPPSVRIARESVPFAGPVAAFAVLARVMYMTAAAGTAAGIDPGRPGVPRFGRQIYHMSAFPARGRKLPLADLAIRRKVGTEPDRLPPHQLAAWRDAYHGFVAGLKMTRFSAVVLDYDGTLCSTDARRGSLSPTVTAQLVRVLDAGLYVAVATGRGKSVRHSLQGTLPRRLWSRVIVGYYNGADIAPLEDNARPDGSDTPCDALHDIARALSSDPVLAQLVQFECRIPQLTIEVRRHADTDQAWALVQHIVAASPTQVSLLRSSHSMDVLAPGVDKCRVVRYIRDVVGSTSGVLCIGDRGRFPGNDHQLLTAPNALSVDECSPGLKSGWNLAPLGHRGPAACISYLRSLSFSQGSARLHTREMGQGTH